MSVASSGLTRTFANGVAVYPTYATRGSASSSVKSSLILVRSSSGSLAAFGLAWSASSSMIRIGQFSRPPCFWASLSQSRRWVIRDTFFLTTAMHRRSGAPRSGSAFTGLPKSRCSSVSGTHRVG